MSRRRREPAERREPRKPPPESLAEKLRRWEAEDNAASTAVDEAAKRAKENLKLDDWIGYGEVDGVERLVINFRNVEPAVVADALTSQEHILALKRKHLAVKQEVLDYTSTHPPVDEPSARRAHADALGQLRDQIARIGEHIYLSESLVAGLRKCVALLKDGVSDGVWSVVL